VSVRSARTGEPADPVRDHLDKAENWLALAEEEREKLQDAVLQEGGRDYIPRGGGYVLLFESAKDLAELHRALAQIYWDTTPQRIAVSPPPDLAGVERLVNRIRADQLAEPSPDEVAQQIREQVKADEAAHQAVTLRPGVDPEPEEEGSLWTFAEPDQAAGEWFWYAVNEARERPRNRWLMVQHYAQVLRWQGEQSTKPIPLTWGEIGHDTDGDAVLRRPTDAERAAFYGPEPDPQPAIEETHERTTTPQVADLWAFTTREGTALAELDPEQLRVLQNTIARHLPVVEDRPRGGAAQWREG